MGHNITALVFQGPIKPAAVAKFDLHVAQLALGFQLAHVDIHYTAYWQKILGLSGTLDIARPDKLLYPDEVVLTYIVQEVTTLDPPEYALIATDYFGRSGAQWGQTVRGMVALDKSANTINQALRLLGVTPTEHEDEFDTLGLARFRNSPESLDRYADLAEALGL